MTMDEIDLKNEEKAVFELRTLYGRYGYTQYKMSKFEEYDLYATNKDFLLSDNIITFTDTNGKLMALKPDVTLSIIKNTEDKSGEVRKVYYNENVYRVSKSSDTYREIMQAGIECIGDIGLYDICEVLLLAAKSLKTIDENSVLDISHFGILSAVTEELKLPGDVKNAVIGCMGKKNVHELTNICEKHGLDEKGIALLKGLVTIYGKPEKALPELKALLFGTGAYACFLQLETIFELLKDSDVYDMLRIDFSVEGGIKYYNGIVFKGFIEGVPGSALSGGQYDRLMKTMKRKSSAIGFAVYLDLLERLEKKQRAYDVDTLLLYDDTVNPERVIAAVRELTSQGISVSAQKNIPEKLRYKRTVSLKNEGMGE